MSTKTGKRRGRRLNTTEEEEKKDVEIIEDTQSNISTDTEKDKDTSLKEIKDDLKDTKDKEINDSPKNKNEKTKESPKKDETKESPKVEKIENGDTAPPPQTIENGAEEPPQEQKTNGEHTTIENQNSLDEPCDMEPLILVDTEEQELQFVSESETSEVDKSPILNRCKTRRSQTRNMPTPKTPKTLDDACQLDLKVTKIEEEDKSELNDTISVESSFSEQTQESDMTNASVLVNFGDTTRNIDITTTTIDESTLNASNFLDSTKDKTYGETLRCLTGRKTLRTNHDYKPRFYNSTIDLTDSSGKYSTLRTGVKRKLESDDEKSPTFLSYLSPFKKAQTQSSTPKLTGFKFGGHEVTEKIEEKNKKWCSIM